MFPKRVIFAAFILAGISCQFSSRVQQKNEKEDIQVQGHRGDRGNFPENTIPAFLSAVRKGVDVLELDVVISKDKKVVVSHEPFMAAEYMLTPEGYRISKNEEMSFNFYEMTYDSIRKFDAGSGFNERFPGQKKMKISKPLLKEVFDTVEEFVATHELKPVSYNIEIKSNAEDYEVFQPLPEEFVKLVMQLVKEKGLEDKVNIQSFDPEPLNILRKQFPDMEIAFLVESGEFAENLSKLDFQPEIYSPYFGLLEDVAMVREIQEMGMKVIPWTVNEKEDMERMVGFKVDGIITDYPEKLIDLLKEK